MSMAEHPTLLHEIRELGDRVGFNLIGLVDAAKFDAARPPGSRLGERLERCGTAIVVAAGGRRFWDLRWNGAPPPRPRRGFHPLDDTSHEWAESVAAMLAARGIEAKVAMPGSDPGLPFAMLGELAGIGTVSPVTGLLLHPEFGPWVSLRAALLIEGTPLGVPPVEPLAEFQPCIDCERPCVSACPSAAVARGQAAGPAGGGIDARACADHRHGGGCAESCAVRQACPIGQTHRYGPAEEAFRHAYSLGMMRRHLGLGLWRWVPRAVRQRRR